jgi:release factor glutamine methyltransferase
MDCERYEITDAASPITILDIGTGSGCIALGLKKQLSNVEVHACDVSETALKVAEKNAIAQDLSIQFHQLDILSSKEYRRLPLFDCIVSNPPYIPLSDKSSMQKNVLEYEPHLALFVENDDPLSFYKAIATFADTNLKPGGSIYLEMHESLGAEVKKIFSSKGFSKIEIRKDMQGKDRMVKVEKEY